MISRLIRFDTPDRPSLERSSESNLHVAAVCRLKRYSEPRPLVEKVDEARDVNQSERRRRLATLAPGGLANKLINLASYLARLFTFRDFRDFRDSLQIGFASLDVLVRESPPAVVASRAGQRQKLAMAHRARAEVR